MPVPNQNFIPYQHAAYCDPVYVNSTDQQHQHLLVDQSPIFFKKQQQSSRSTSSTNGSSVSIHQSFC